eukprot:734658_1
MSTSALFCFLTIYQTRSSVFNCSEPNSCNQLLRCANGEDCDVFCTGSDACNEAIIFCPKGANNCNIICDGTNNAATHNGCYSAIINASSTIGGNLSVSAINNIQIMRQSKVYCPNNGQCIITCEGTYACESITVHSQPTTSLLSVTGTGNNVLSMAVIHCPYNLQPGFSYNCYIEVYGSYKGMIQLASVFAVESFNDVSIICRNASDQCLYNNIDLYPTMHCNVGQCHMKLVDGRDDKWECFPSYEKCNDYHLTLNPTFSPTESTISPSTSAPSTSSPSISPTFIISTHATISSLVPSTEHNIQLTYQTYIFISLTLFILVTSLVIIAGFHAKYKGYSFHWKSLYSFLIYSLDFISDLFFCTNLYHKSAEDKTYFNLFILAITFLAIPSMISLYEMEKIISRFSKLNDDKIKTFFLENSLKLYAVCLITGHCCASLRLFSSNLFDHNLFKLSLNHKQILLIENDYFLYHAIFEAIPQLVISIWYSVHSEKVFMNDIVIFTFIFGISSLVISFFAFISRRKLLKEHKNGNQAQYHLLQDNSNEDGKL